MLLTPTNADVADLDSTAEFITRMDEARDSNEDLKILVVISRAPTHAKSRFRDVAIAALCENTEEFALADTVVFSRRIYPDALKAGLSVLEASARTSQAREEIQNLAQEIAEYAVA